MAQVLTGGELEFNALVYGMQHPNTLKFLEGQYHQYREMSPMLSDAGQQFFNTFQNTYNEFNSASALRQAQLALNKVDAIFQIDQVKSIWELAQIQNAAPIMQRWIMAEPLVRQMYHEQRLDGFSDTYVDMEPGMVGRDHYDYRQVVSGVLVDDEEHDWHATIYMDDLKPGDQQLSLEQKVDIMNTWDIVRFYLERGKEDPTSVLGAGL